MAVTQQLARVFAVFTTAAEIFAKAPCFELHVSGAFVALDNGTIVAPNFELTGFYFESAAIWIIAAYVELSPSSIR